MQVPKKYLTFILENKKYLPIAIAAVSGLLAIFLINAYINQQTEDAKRRALLKEKEMVRVVIAKKDIAMGQTVEEDMLKEETVHRSLLQPKAAGSIDRVTGKIALAPIGEGEQILLNKVSFSQEDINLSSRVPRGKRAITIPVDNLSSVGGMVKAGDHVDLIAMVPIPVQDAQGNIKAQMTNFLLVQDVLVLALNEEVSTRVVTKGAASTSNPMVTLALSAQEASLVSFVQEQGKIRMILRSPQDTQVQPPAAANWETVFRMLYPQQERMVEPGRRVEVYHGLKKEIRTLER